MSESVRIKLCYIIAVMSMTSALPEDWKPKRIAGAQAFSVAFTGKGENEEFRELLDLQEMKIVEGEWAIVTARNNIFVLDLKTVNFIKPEIKFSQVVEWDPENSTTCGFRTPDRRKCNNFIRVSARMSDRLFLMCGTNARDPVCREYEWDGQKFAKFYPGDRCTDTKTCLLDDGPSLAYAYSGGNFYMATRIGYRNVATLRRAVVNGQPPATDFGVNLKTSSGNAVARDEPLTHLSTDNNDASMLNDPFFVSTVETANKIYIFFRENALEQFGNEKLTVSRVAQVCKNDRGGNQNIRKHKWTSYFKARLNCSHPGTKPFEFNELRHLTKSILINGVTTVFAVMTTPENSIWGSAICAYTVPNIEKAMNGDFMKRSGHDATSVCWSKYGQKAPFGDNHPTGCAAAGVDTRDMANEDLRFRRNHPLMQASVQPITDQPLFTRTQSRYLFTAIDVEHNVTLDTEGRAVTLFYVGTSDGKILKVVPRSFDTDDRYDATKLRKDGTFVEEWQVYDSTKCKKVTGRSPIISNNALAEESDAARVLTISAVERRNIIMVGFRNCVIAIPKQLCSEYRCRRSCVQSGNPYCGWLDGLCVPLASQNEEEIEQDLFAEKDDLPDCPSGDNSGGTNRTTFDDTTGGNPGVEKKFCNTSSTSLAVSIAVSMSCSFLLSMIVFFIVYKCKNTRRKHTSNRSSIASKDQNSSEGNPTIGTKRQSNRRPIYTGPRNTNQSSNTTTRSRLSSSVEQQQKAHFGYTQEDSSPSSAGELPPPYVYNSLDSINSFSCTSTSESEHQKLKNAHIVDNFAPVNDEKSPTSPSNLNNNNLKRNSGIANSIVRSESPVRRRSVGCQDIEVRSTPSSIRMGISSGKTANSTPRPTCLKHPNLKTENVVSVLPMTTDQTTKSCENTGKRHSTLPKPPVSGLVRKCSPNAPMMVSNYNEIDSAQSRTLKRGQSLNEPYYTVPPREPVYENTKYRKASTPGDFGRKPSTPPSSDSKQPNRKFSSFTASHFNTSWFPAPGLNEGIGKYKISEAPGGRLPSSNSGGMSSSSSASATGPVIIGSRRRNAKSTDEGYGSEFISNESERIFVNNERLFTPIAEVDSHIYSNIADSPINFTNSIDDGNDIREELDRINWSEQFNKTSKRKKHSRKKKNTDKRTLVRELDSPSDSDNVFCEAVSSGARGIYLNDSPNIGRTLDDSFVKSNAMISEENDASRSAPYAFHTMRPPGRMRQKLPRLRCAHKESDATLIAVPTPAIPK